MTQTSNNIGSSDNYSDRQALAHYLLMESLVENGHALSRAELADRMALRTREIEVLYREMEANHAMVLHPHEPEPWIIHPFSLSPTATWVEHDGRGWWAPCMWCALGIITLIGGSGRIHTRLGGEQDPITITIDGDRIVPDDLLIHFAIRPSRAWDNVHHTCNCCLPFPTDGAIDEWSQYHRLPRGESVPIRTLAALSKVWYGSHRDRHWRKWSVTQAQEIFDSVGLSGSFWKLAAPRNGRF